MMTSQKSPLATFLTLGTLAIVWAFPAHAFETVSEIWIERWRADLEFARTEFPEAHANLFHKMSKEEFESQLSDLSARIPELSHQEIVMELARIVVLIQDGHSRVTQCAPPSRRFWPGPAMAFGVSSAEWEVHLSRGGCQRLGRCLQELPRGSRVAGVGSLGAACGWPNAPSSRRLVKPASATTT